AFQDGSQGCLGPKKLASSILLNSLMFLPTVNKPKQLLHLSFIDRVRLAELTQSRDEIVTLLADLTPGFRVLSDLGRLDSIEDNCETEIGKIMELCDQKGVGLVVRMIPDPTKDIGLNRSE